ncbi:hypothetical protein B0H66DRAFT_604046 [Apodospora peruviana]|uniref:Poly [ADP-ribose] polymerase n=1 Tax=Apodospora peruviana TaxID=516989 RepID=A0AAE0M1J6_9PEZI|nr:hypothetical protein B0H66DRAFT_604046 [Apodospora peruviana]
MFGPGIYTTTVSSKADIYVKNKALSNKHVMIVCRIADTHPQYLTTADHHRSSPDPG